MKQLLAAVAVSLLTLVATPAAAVEPVQLIPVHTTVTVAPAGAFALTQPWARCPWGCSFHYFEPGSSFEADYVITSPLDGYRYYVVTVGDQAGYVLVAPKVGVGF